MAAGCNPLVTSNRSTTKGVVQLTQRNKKGPSWWAGPDRDLTNRYLFYGIDRLAQTPEAVLDGQTRGISVSMCPNGAAGFKPIVEGRLPDACRTSLRRLWITRWRSGCPGPPGRPGSSMGLAGPFEGHVAARQRGPGKRSHHIASSISLAQIVGDSRAPLGSRLRLLRHLAATCVANRPGVSWEATAIQREPPLDIPLQSTFLP